MSQKRELLSEDARRAQETHYRWISKIPLNRDYSLPDYKDEWRSEQCFQCQFYIKLTGYLETDWGVCSNPLSPLDSRLMFEHDGCDYFSRSSDRG